MGELGIHKVTYELNCKPIVESILVDKVYLKEFDSILAKCKESLGMYENFEISFEANRIAYNLAKASCFYANHQVLEYVSS